MSEALYNKLVERWVDFLDDDEYFSYPADPESLMDNYDDLASRFCEKYRYSEKTEEFAFHGQWYDTFADEYFKRLEKHGFDNFPEDQTSSRIETEGYS